MSDLRYVILWLAILAGGTAAAAPSSDAEGRVLDYIRTHLQPGQPLRITSHTVAVNIHGAMVVCPRMLDPETKLELVNGRTDEKIGSRVSRAPRESSEGYLIPVEFTAPSPNFWQISFPPANWKVPEN